MYERFTPDARRSMVAANQQAMRLCHKYIGTDDILIGIVTSASGIVAEVVNLHGVTEPKLQECLSDMSRMESPVSTLRAKTVIENAMKRCRELYHLELSLAHVLLGLLDCSPSDALHALGKIGVDVDQMKRDLISRLPAGSPEEIARRKEIEQTFKDHPEVVALKKQIEELQSKKENAIKSKEFEMAASILRQQDALRKSLEELYGKLS
jgi:ATP-dependent Clp protease ATP-binding subunit ClpA